MSIRLRLLAGFAALLMIAGICIGAVVYTLAQQGMNSISQKGAEALKGRAMDQLESVRSSKASHVNDLFQSIRDQIITFSEDLTVVEACRDMRESFSLLLNEAEFFPWDVEEARESLRSDYAGSNYLQNSAFKENTEIAGGYAPRAPEAYLPPDEISIHLQYMYIHENGNPNKVGEKHLLDANQEILTYNEDHKRFHPIIRNYLETFGYYDIFIIDPTSGKIIYSVFKEKDYATSLKTGPYKDTNFARCFQEADAAGRKGQKDFVSIVDFEPYEPSYNAPAAFIGSPIMDTSDQYLGVLIFQMPVDKINTVMLSDRKWQQVGLGNTGETYMVGPDFKMRSQSRFTSSGVDTINREVRTKASEAALAGETGSGTITNYLGETVLSSWQPLDVSGLKYALIAEIQESEALASSYAISDESAATQANMLTASAIVLLGALAAGLVGTFFVVRSITRPLGRIHDFAKTVEGGDLDADLQGAYPGELNDLKHSIQAMVAQLKNRLGFSQGVMEGVSSCFPCIMVGADGRITQVNSALIDIMEKTGEPDDFIGQTTGMFFHGDEGKSTEIVDSLENDCRMSEELEITTPTGKIKVLSMNATPIKDLDGERLGVFTVYYDLTTIRHQEAEISSQNERMVEASNKANIIADNVATAVDQLVAQLDQVRKGSDLQSQRANETATAMQEMNATVLEVAQNASQAADSASQARGEATEGDRTVEMVVDAIGDVRNQMNQLRANMDSLGEQAQGIGQVITVIEDIADQTNLLALNAAIEAARAGEAGRGFAVVADEVRKLAEKTMDATKEVSEAIRSIQEGAKASIQATETATTSVESSTELAGQSGERLRTIVGIVAETAGQVESIATASEEQSAASEQVSQSVEEIDRISGETAEGVKQAGEAVNALSEQTNELTALIGRLKS